MLNLISKSNLTFTSNKDCGCSKKVSTNKYSKSSNDNITYKKYKTKNTKKNKGRKTNK